MSNDNSPRFSKAFELLAEFCEEKDGAKKNDEQS